MSQEIINYGAAPNDGTGDPLRVAFIKTDNNFDQIWAAGPVGSNITILNNTIQVTNTNGNLTLATNGTGVISTRNHVRPGVSQVYDLGSANLRYRLGYFTGLNIDGNVTITGNLSAGNISYTSNLFIGDLQGSVFADDSTIMVDAIDNVLRAGAIYTDDYFYANGSPYGVPTGNNGAVQINWLEGFSNQGGTPGDTYSTMQFDSDGLLNVNGATAYQPRVDYTSYVTVNTPRVESTDFDIVAGPGITVVGYDDNYNTPRSAYMSVQDQATATQQWDFGILGNGSNAFSIRNRTASTIPLVISTDGAVTASTIITNNISSDDSSFVTIQDGLNVIGDIETRGNVTADYFYGDGSQLLNIPVGNNGAIQVAWLGKLSNQGGTPDDTYSTLQFDSNGMPTLDGTDAYQQRVDYSPYLQVLAPEVESTDFGIIAGPGITVVGYDDNYNTPRSAYMSVQDQANVTQQWDFGILGNGSNNYSIRDRTNSNTWTFGITGDLSAPGNVSADNVLTSADVIANGVIQSGTGLSTGGYLSVNGTTDLHDTTVTGNLSVSVIRNNDSTIVLIEDGVDVDGNVTADYFIGDGSQLTGLPASYSNSNVTTLLSNLGSNVISGTGNITTTANISGAYIKGNGSELTNLPAPVVTQDITSTGDMSIMTYDGVIKSVNYATVEPSSGDIKGGNISARGNITAVNLDAVNLVINSIASDDSTFVTIRDSVNIDTGFISSPENILLTADANTWTFGTNGNITLPRGGIVYETNIPGGVLSGNTIALTPQGGTSTDQQLLIYPTADPTADANHLHLTSGNLYNTELFLGNDNLYIKLANTGNVVINSNDDVGNSAQWTFDTTGRVVNLEGLTLTAGGQFNICTILTGGSGYGGGGSFSATTGGSGTGLTVGYGYGLSDQVVNASVINPGDGNYQDGDVITMTAGNGAATFRLTQYNVLGNQANNNFVESNWTFDNTGNLTVPGGIVGSGASPAPYLSGFSSVSAMTLSASGNVTGGNILTAGIVSATGNVSGNFFIGNGSQLTGLPATYGNANVVANLAALGSNPISSTGNITTTANVSGGNLIVSGAIVGSGASPAPSLSGFSSVSAITFGATGQIVSTASGNSADGGGQIYLNGATNNRIDWNTNGTGAPAFTTRSAGSKIVLYPLTNGTNTDYAMGINSGTFWSSVPQFDNALQFKWYGGITEIASLSGTGVFSATGNITGGNLITAGLVSVTGNITSGNISTGKITLTNGAVIRDTAGDAVAFGQDAGLTSQGNNAVAVGQNAGHASQGINAVAIGYLAGNSSQGVYTVAIGNAAGQTSQGSESIAIGSTAGQTTQGAFSVAVGLNAGRTTQGSLAVALGYNAGLTSQGQEAVAIGYGAGQTSQATNSIILNATGAQLNQTTANTFTVAPVRNDVANTGQVMFYNTTSKEITYGNVINVAGNITGGNLITAGLATVTGNITGGNIITTGNVTGNTAGFTIGYRDIPQVAFTANTTLAATDAGKHYYSTLATANTLTIANNTSVSWSVGSAISIVNRGTGNITVAQGTGVSLYLAGNATAGNRIVSTYGMATLLNVAANVWMINGTGVA